MSGMFLRKASKDLIPSESPFFSLKALSSSPWSAKPFMRTPYAHRAFGVKRNAYSSAFNELEINDLEDDSEAILRHWRTALPTSRHAAKSQSRSNFYVVQGAFTVGFRHHNLGSGFSAYGSIILLDLCRFIEHSSSDLISSMYRKAEVPADIDEPVRSHQSQRT